MTRPKHIPPQSWPDPDKREPADVARVALHALALIDRDLDFVTSKKGFGEWEDGEGRPTGRIINRAVAYLRMVAEEEGRP